MPGVVSDIADVGGHGRGQQALDEDVPLLRELRPQVRIPRAHLARRLVERPQLGEAGGQRPRTRRRIVIDRRFEEERRVERQPQVRARPFHVLRDAVAAAQHPLIGRMPGQPEPRLEPFLVGLVQRAALAAAIFREGLRSRRQIEIRLTVVLLDDRLRVGPAHAEIQRESGRDLDVVLDVDRAPVVQVRPGLRQTAAAFAGHLVEEEIRKREAGKCAAVAEQPQQAVVACVEAALHVMKQLTAELQRLASFDPGELLVDLIGLVEGVGVARAGAHCGQPAAPAYRAEARDRLAARDPEGGVAVTDSSPVQGVRDDGDPVVANQQFVDDRPADHAVPVDRQVAERRRCLVAQEQRRGALGVARLVLGEREASEDFVRRRGVPVDARVPLPRANRRQRLADIVAGDAAHGPVRQRVRRVVQDRKGDRADPGNRNLVAGKRQVGGRIPDRRGDAREIAAAPRLRCDRDRLGSRGVEARALIVAEEEQFVLRQGPAQRAAVDVLPAFRLGGRRAVVGPGVGVHRAVAVEVEEVALEPVRPRLDDVADDGAGHVAGVGGVVVGLDADLRQRVGAGLVGDEIVDRLVHVDAVDRVVVGLLAVAVHERPAAAEVADRGKAARVRRHGAR